MPISGRFCRGSFSGCCLEHGSGTARTSMLRVKSSILEIGMVARMEKMLFFSKQSLISSVSNDGSNSTQRVLDVSKVRGWLGKQLEK